MKVSDAFASPMVVGATICWKLLENIHTARALASPPMAATMPRTIETSLLHALPMLPDPSMAKHTSTVQSSSRTGRVITAPEHTPSESLRHMSPASGAESIKGG